MFLHNKLFWDDLQDGGYHNAATVMVIGSGTTSASTAFTVSNYSGCLGMTGLTIDDAMNVFIGDMRPAATSGNHENAGQRSAGADFR